MQTHTRSNNNDDNNRDKDKIIIIFSILGELKKLRNMKVTFIPSVVSTLGKFPKGLERKLEELEIRRRIVTIKTTVRLRSVKLDRRVLKT